jgi:anti-sigma B factor antagonist
MLLNAETLEGITTVQLPERINSTNNLAFEKEVAPLLKPDAKLIFDLTHVKHLDSSALGSMVAVVKRLRTDGGDLKLCALSKQIRTLFEIVRMHHVFDIFNTRQEAIDSYK